MVVSVGDVDEAARAVRAWADWLLMLWSGDWPADWIAREEVLRDVDDE